MGNDLFFCKMCTHPSSRPRIAFDENGLCNGCQRTLEKKNEIDWKEKEEELKALISKAMDGMPDRQYDCLVPVSGGKDSTFQAWYASKVLGLRTLCYNHFPILPTEEGALNVLNIAEKLPVDMISFRPNREAYSKVMLANFELHGDPYPPASHLTWAHAARIAVEKKIPIILYGENGDREYAGSSSPEYNTINNAGVVARIRSNKINYLPPEKWTEYGLTPSECLPWCDPSDEIVNKMGIERIFLSDYLPWSNNYHLHVALNIVGGFRMNEGRSPGTYTFGYSTDNDLYDFYIWMLWPKFGFCRATKYTSKDIQEGKLTREMAMSLVRDYDGEFPWAAADRFMEIVGIGEDRLWQTIAKFIGDDENVAKDYAISGNKKIAAWQKIGDMKWRLKNTIHGEEKILELPIPRVLTNI